jgi:hypothetical protein
MHHMWMKACTDLEQASRSMRRFQGAYAEAVQHSISAAAFAMQLPTRLFMISSDDEQQENAGGNQSRRRHRRRGFEQRQHQNDRRFEQRQHPDDRRFEHGYSDDRRFDQHGRSYQRGEERRAPEQIEPRQAFSVIREKLQSMEQHDPEAKQLLERFGRFEEKLTSESGAPIRMRASASASG